MQISCESAAVRMARSVDRIEHKKEFNSTGRKKLAGFHYLGIQVHCVDVYGRAAQPFYAVHPLSQRTLWAESAHKMRQLIWNAGKN